MGEAASEPVLQTYHRPSPAVTRAILDAFHRQCLACIRYEDRQGVLTEREVELQYLYYNVPVWYALTWDRLRNDVRFFRIDRVRCVSVLTTAFALRPSRDFIRAGEPEARRL